jgi:hypothetical protein
MVPEVLVSATGMFPRGRDLIELLMASLITAKHGTTETTVLVLYLTLFLMVK